MKPEAYYIIKFHRPDGSAVQLPNPANPAEMIDGVETNSVQFIRVIKDERGQAPEDGHKPITERDVVLRMAIPMLTTGNNYKAQVAQKNKDIRDAKTRPLDEAAFAAGNLNGASLEARNAALADAEVIIGKLNDPDNTEDL